MQLLELEDQTWFPRFLRDAMTDYLSFMADMAEKPLQGFATKLGKAMKASRPPTSTIVELGAGGGGPSMTLTRLLKRQGFAIERLIVTDLFPNLPKLRLAAGKASVPVTVIDASIDATNVPEDLVGLRLLCNIFHHLSPDAATRCLGDAVSKRQPIALLEMVARSPSGFFQVFAGVLVMLFATPFIRPFRVSRLVFTYIIPIIPLATIWDGIVSCMRVYSPEEMRALIDRLPANGYRWEVGRLPVRGAPLKITYLIGVP